MGFSERDVLDQMRNFICHFLDIYTKNNGKKRWAEKTTHNVNCAKTIDKIFEESPLYIALVRHGMDVAYSFEKLKFDKFTVLDKYRLDGADTPKAAIRHWAAMNKMIAEFSDHVGDRLLWIRYEKLCSVPEEILKQICKFLDEPWDEGMLSYNEKKHDSGYEDPNADKQPTIIYNSERYKNWPFEFQKKIFCEAQDMFEYFDYDL